MNPTETTTQKKPKPLWKTYTIFLVPMILSNLLQSLSGTVNNIYLGQMLGVSAMAAVSAFFPVLFFTIAFNIGIGTGASVLIGQAWGAKDVDRVKAIAGSTLLVGISLGIVVAIMGSTFTEPLLRALGTPADILPDTVTYARIMFLGAPCVYVFLLMTSMLRGVGDSKTPMLTLLISTLVGMVLTPALIRGWGGLPMLGIRSSAYATLTAFVIAITWTVWYLRRPIHKQFAKGEHPLAPHADFLQTLRFNKELMAKVLRIGLPSGITIVTMALAELAVLSLVNSHGSQATAAYGAVIQIVNYVQFPAISIAIAASILGAQAIGAGRGQTALGHIAKTGITLNVVLTGALVLLGYIFSRAMIGLFITDPAVVETAQSLLHIMLWGNIVFGMAMVLSGLMRASGTVLFPTIITMFSLAGVLIPVATVLNQRFGLPGIWAGFPIAFTAMLLMQTAYYRLVWKKKTLRPI